MPDTQLHNLTDGTAPQSADEFYAVRAPYSSGNDIKLTWAEILVSTDLRYKHNIWAPEDFGTIGVNATQDTAAVNAMLSYLLTQGYGTGTFPSVYNINGPLNLKPTSNQIWPLMLKGTGGQLNLTTSNAGFVIGPNANGINFRNFTLEDIQTVVFSNSVSDAFLFTDNSTTGQMYNFVVRDCFVNNDASASAWTGNGFHFGGTQGGIYQTSLENLWAADTSNTTGTGILFDNTGGCGSSHYIRNPYTQGFKYGMKLGLSQIRGDSSRAEFSGAINGGTIIQAQNEGIVMITTNVVKSSLYGTHVENNWLSAANKAAGGGGVYWEGAGVICDLQDERNTGAAKQKWAIDSFPLNGDLVVIGLGSTDTYPFIRVPDTNNAYRPSGTLVTQGVGIDQIDISGTSVAGRPYLDLYQSKARVDLSISSNLVAVDPSKGQLQCLNVNQAAAVTISSPTTGFPGAVLRFVISNIRGGGGAITINWDTGYHLTGWTDPAAGKTRTVTFVCKDNGSTWYAIGNPSGDITT